jgi:hypothetical protein
MTFVFDALPEATENDDRGNRAGKSSLVFHSVFEGIERDKEPTHPWLENIHASILPRVFR